MVIPQAIGTDINCGMRLLTTGVTQEQAAAQLSALERRLIRLFLEGGRDVPVSGNAFRALFDVGAEAFIDAVPKTGMWSQASPERLHAELAACIGLSEFSSNARWAPQSLVSERETIRDPSLGSIGSGNHFVEFQVVDQIYDRQAAYRLGLKEGNIAVMIHSGSRDVGFFVGQRWMDRAQMEWPQGMKHPHSGLYALTGPLATEYLEAMGVAARYAWLNRVVLGEMVRQTLRDVLHCDDSRMVVDVPHNVVLQEDGLNLHRKGATPARAQDLALIPGSMGDFSYLIEGLGNPDWLSSCSHGAGRSVRRQAMRALKPLPEQEATWRCLTLREERKIEEAPQAYKPVGPVIASQEEQGMIRSVARFKPWLTVKA
jgi:tRNA-splicing ligase RtcB